MTLPAAAVLAFGNTRPKTDKLGDQDFGGLARMIDT
jgi:hypothetical protein